MINYESLKYGKRNLNFVFGKKNKAIKCVQTKKIFDSATIAAQYYGLKYRRVTESARSNGRIKLLGTFSFKYVESN